MGRTAWAALAAGTAIVGGLTLARPHRVAATPPSAPTRSESEIRSLDIDFYEDALSGYDRDSHLEQLKLFNAQAWRIFRWSLTEDEYARMQPEERDGSTR